MQNFFLDPSEIARLSDEILVQRAREYRAVLSLFTHGRLTRSKEVRGYFRRMLHRMEHEIDARGLDEEAFE